MSTNLDHYKKEVAVNYEDNRKGEKWESEGRAFDALIEGLKVNYVLDCPIGTGRWLPSYQEKLIESPKEVIGVDVSQDMLEQSKVKARDNGFSFPVRFERASILDPKYSLGSLEEPSLVVCTRFLNWITIREVRNAINNLLSSRPKYFLVSVRCRGGTWLIDSLVRKVKHAIGKRVVIVHDRFSFMNEIILHGYEIRKEIFVEKRAGSVYSYVLFERGGE